MAPAGSETTRTGDTAPTTAENPEQPPECAECAELKRAEAAANEEGDRSAAVDKRVLLHRHKKAQHRTTDLAADSE